MPGRVELVKWALAEGCPREHENGITLAHIAAQYEPLNLRGQRLVGLELVKWLCGEGGFAMDEMVMSIAARSGNLEMAKWFRGKGCDWGIRTCNWAIEKGDVEVLRWARVIGCLWTADIRDWAAEKVGYTDNLGNLAPLDAAVR